MKEMKAGMCLARKRLLSCMECKSVKPSWLRRSRAGGGDDDTDPGRKDKGERGRQCPVWLVGK